MVKWLLSRLHDGEWHWYTLTRDGEEVAIARWREHGTDAEIHNDIYQVDKSVIVKCREAFQEIRCDMAEAGCTKVITMSAYHDSTMAHYWRLMGFEFTGIYQHENTTVYYAVMEV